MNTEAFWTLIGVVTGSLLGWFLTELSNFFRFNSEIKRTVNKVIFNLLNIRFELKKLDNAGVSEAIINKMHEKMGDPLPSYDVNKITEIINTESKELLEFNALESLEEISKQFSDVLQEFAKIDPIGAYRLSDEAKIFRKIDDLEDYLDAVRKKYGSAIPDEVFSDLQIYLKEKVFKESIHSLEKEIIKLSSRTSKKKRKLISESLKSQNSKNIGGDTLNELINIAQSGIK
jgi:transcriptional regulator NrdR family protein